VVTFPTVCGYKENAYGGDGTEHRARNEYSERKNRWVFATIARSACYFLPAFLIESPESFDILRLMIIRRD